LERSRENLEITLQDLKSLVKIRKILSAIEKKKLQYDFDSRKNKNVQNDLSPGGNI